MPMLRWRKSWTWENLQGSIRKDLSPAERSVWADLLDLCGLCRRWGVVERSEGLPYTDEEFAQMFITPVPVIKSAISKCVAEGRLRRGPAGELVVNHWDKYQANESRGIPKKVSIDKARKTRNLAADTAVAAMAAVNKANAMNQQTQDMLQELKEGKE